MSYPLHQAVLGCKRDVVEQLLATSIHSIHISNLDEFGQTPLHWAVFGGYYEIAELLLKNGADPNAIATDGVSPLWRAEDFGLEGIAELIRQYGGESLCQ